MFFCRAFSSCENVKNAVQFFVLHGFYWHIDPHELANLFFVFQVLKNVSYPVRHGPAKAKLLDGPEALWWVFYLAVPSASGEYSCHCVSLFYRRSIWIYEYPLAAAGVRVVEPHNRDLTMIALLLAWLSGLISYGGTFGYLTSVASKNSSLMIEPYNKEIITTKKSSSRNQHKIQPASIFSGFSFISDSTSATPFLRFLIALPMPEPISGSYPAPKITSAITRIISSSQCPNPNM